MINLTLGTEAYIYLTLTEKITLTSPNYLFVFTQRTTNEITSFVKLNAADISDFKARYNLFVFDVDVLFNTQIGEYYYDIYEQASSSNLNPTLAHGLLESGVMKINELSEDVFTYTKYNSNNIFITR